MSLLRLVEIEEGEVRIDELSSKEIPLQILRKHILPIPQDPVLWSESLYFNLCLGREVREEECWRVIEEVGLKEKVELLGGLHSTLDSHSSLSVGEKQLLCLARSLLLQAKVLILDESTASIDRNSEIRIQKVIDTLFSNCTLLVIAHRLETIM